jgi:sulfite exporter TauE/SafE
MLISGLALALFTGVISSFGHCLGMCGGIVAMYAARQPVLVEADGKRPSVLVRVRALAPLHMGRIATYTLLGGLIGFAGSLLDKAGGLVGWQGVFSVIVGIAMIALALSLMGVLPPVEIVLASMMTAGSPIKRMRALFGKRSFLATLGLGVLWGFLPCGLVFAMLVVSAGTQSPWGGALTMLAFGLGTVPTLLGFGLAANLLSVKFRGRLQFLAGILILLFATQTILRGLAAANVIPSLIIGPVMLW